MRLADRFRRDKWRGSASVPPGTTRSHVKKRSNEMPKMKTKSGAAKRFKVRASGSIKRSQAFKRHILTKKTSKRIRQLRGTAEIHRTDEKSVRAMLPYA
jgi:large subunit ribosomal protein L35